MHRTLSRFTATQPTASARSRLTPVATWGHADAPEVSDSEPEREERRQEERKNRKRYRQHRPPIQRQSDVIALTGTQEPVLTQPVSQASQFPPATQSVISIQDDSSDHASDVGILGEGLQIEHGRTCNAPVEGIIDISDVASDGPSMPSVHALLAKRVRSPDYEEPPIDIPRPISDRSNSSRASTEVSDSDGEGRAGLNLKLKGFAYDGSLSGKSRNPSSASASRSGSIVSVASALKQTKATSKAKMTFAEEFTEADLARLLKCVSCELTWTTRKSVAQKLKHIQACAKKRSLTDSTVAFLLRSELAAAPPLPDKSAGAEKAQEPGTLLETWTDGTNKRRTKRRAVSDAVRSLSDTRGQILDRARALLGEPSREQHVGAEQTEEGPRIRNEDEGAQMPPPTQAFGESALAKNRLVQQEPIQSIAFASTQQFAPSRLVASRTASSPTVEDLEDEIDMPPPTQKFAPSRFAIGSSNNRILHEASKVPGPESTVVHSPSTSANAVSPTYQQMDPMHIDRHSPSDLNLHSDVDPESPRHVVTDYYEYDYSPEDWMDDAYLHFNPEDDVRDYALPAVEEGQSLSPVAGPSRPQRTRNVDSSTVVTKEVDAVAVAGEPAMAPSKQAAKKPRSKKGKQPASSSPGKENPPEITEAEFESRLHNTIMQDKSLHLRIIRYEPIHFDVFMQLATDAGLVQARKLGLVKSRVRTFLDKMAIHFYGADGPGGERTRRRHP